MSWNLLPFFFFLFPFGRTSRLLQPERGGQNVPLAQPALRGDELESSAFLSVLWKHYGVFTGGFKGLCN